MHLTDENLLHCYLISVLSRRELSISINLFSKTNFLFMVLFYLHLLIMSFLGEKIDFVAIICPLLFFF